MVIVAMQSIIFRSRSLSIFNIYPKTCVVESLLVGTCLTWTALFGRFFNLSKKGRLTSHLKVKCGEVD